MAKKRDRLEVIYDILTTIRENKEGVRVTRILYKSNLSYNMLQDYIQDLIARKFIKEEKIENNRKSYTITSEGVTFLLKYREIKDFVDSFVT